MSSGTRLQTLRHRYPPETPAPSSMEIITNYAAKPLTRSLLALSAAVLASAVKTAPKCISAIHSFHSSSRRGRPPDRSLSEEGILTMTSIPARLSVRRGDRATAWAIGSTASSDKQASKPGCNRGPGDLDQDYLLRRHDGRALPWLGVRDVTDHDHRDTDVSTVTMWRDPKRVLTIYRSNP